MKALLEISVFFLIGAAYGTLKPPIIATVKLSFELVKSFFISLYKAHNPSFILKNTRLNRALSPILIILTGLFAIAVNYALCDGVFRFHYPIFILIGYFCSRFISDGISPTLSLFALGIFKTANRILVFALTPIRFIIRAVFSRVIIKIYKKLKKSFTLPFTKHT
jgi:hypothetical protein